MPQRSGRSRKPYSEFVTRSRPRRRAQPWRRRPVDRYEYRAVRPFQVGRIADSSNQERQRISEGLASWCATMSQLWLWLFPRTRGLGAVERNSFRFLPADRFARSNGTNGTEKRTVLGELHRDLSYLMTGKGAWVAGVDRREAPGPKPEHLGRRLRLRHQPPRSWQLLNGGDQRGVSAISGHFAHRAIGVPLPQALQTAFSNR